MRKVAQIFAHRMHADSPHTEGILISGCVFNGVWSFCFRARDNFGSFLLPTVVCGLSLVSLHVSAARYHRVCNCSEFCCRRHTVSIGLSLYLSHCMYSKVYSMVYSAPSFVAVATQSLLVCHCISLIVYNIV